MPNHPNLITFKFYLLKYAMLPSWKFLNSNKLNLKEYKFDIRIPFKSRKHLIIPNV